MSSKLGKILSENGVRLHVLQHVGAAFLSEMYQLSLITVEENSANERVSVNDQLSPVVPQEPVNYSRALDSYYCLNIYSTVGGSLVYAATNQTN